MIIYPDKLVLDQFRWGMNPRFNYYAYKLSLLVILISLISLIGCRVEIPAAAKELAISALCELPPFSGNNICREVEVTKVYRESLIRNAIRAESQPCWCMELTYIDYTGDSGFASIWVVEDSGIGDYQILEGPYLAIPCSMNHD